MQTALILEDFADTRIWLCEALLSAFNDIAISEAATVAQAKELIKNQTFDLALIDLSLPDGSGIDVITEIIRQSPTTYCVVATIFEDDEHIFPALQAGAQGYLLKEQAKDEFIKSLNGLLHGEPPLSPVIARKILRHFQKTESRNQALEEIELTERETEILTLVAKGLRRGDISQMLGISPHTVASHLKTIYGKLNVSTRAEATVEALRMGLISI
jgi:DNA-binding NarL/FixJ family response regulator